uniref:Uncharacterized protein n=1 Tax=Schizaphis graminum TaxID=13262 RepID=A0A2S2NJP4_SCHGA
MNEPPIVYYVYMCVRVCNVYACACVLVAHMKTVMCGGTNSHTCVYMPWSQTDLTFFVAYRHRLRGKQLYFNTIIVVYHVRRARTGWKNVRMLRLCPAAAAGSVLLEAGALFFKTKHFFILLARCADGQSHSHTTFLQCSVASPLPLGWRSRRSKTVPSHHVVRFVGDKLYRIDDFRGKKTTINFLIPVMYPLLGR